MGGGYLPGLVTTTLALADMKHGENAARARASSEVARDTPDALASELARLRTEFDQFTYSVSHDFNAPVRGIVNVTQWLEEEIDPGALTEDIKKYLEILRDRSLRMRQMLEVLLRISRIPREPLSIARFAPEQVAREIGVSCRGEREFSFEVRGDVGELETSQALFTEALTALVDNAFRHHDRGAGAVIVEFERADAQLLVRVIDDGPGITPSLLGMVRGLFRLGKASSDPASVGGGFSIVDKICQVCGASLELEPRGKVVANLNPLQEIVARANARESATEADGQERGLVACLRWPLQGRAQGAGP